LQRGWIKLHREILGKTIFKLSTPQQCKILIVILLRANHSPNEWQFKGNKYICQPGQFVTSYEELAEECGKGISVQNVRTALSKFEKLGFLTRKSTYDGTLITIVNWALYQGTTNETNTASNTEVTPNQHAPNTDATTNKNNKNDKNGEKIIPLMGNKFNNYIRQEYDIEAIERDFLSN